MLLTNQSRDRSWGTFFTWFQSLPVFEKKRTGYTCFLVIAQYIITGRIVHLMHFGKLSD